jgi:Tol biopolymer transport system component/DNA-binding winged helix-turn-helix (wHTH) protein
MTDSKSFVFRFGDIEVRESEFTLTRAGATIKVEPTAFRVLLYLLRNSGRLVAKDEIMAAVWHDTAVSDNSLTRSIATLRRILDDSSREPRLIATVQTLGYRFLVPVEKWPIDPTPESASVPVEAAAQDRNKTENAPSPTAVPPPSVGMRRSAPRWLIPACAGLLVAAVLAGFHFFGNGRARANADTAYPSFVKAARPIVTVPGLVRYPALSPDGRQIAFTWESAAQPRDDLYVQLIGGDQPLRLTHNTSGYICCAAWSPDGQQIAYGHCDDHGGAVFVIPALGGVERKITEVVCLFGQAGWPRWTADGESLVLADQCTPMGPRGVLRFSLRTGERLCLASPPPGVDDGDTWPSLSPDQKTVAFFRSITGNHDEVYTVDIAGKKLRQLTHSGYGLSGPLMWTVDGKFVMFNSGTPDIRGPVRVSVDGGVLEAASTFPATGSLSRDGRRLAYVEGTKSASIWRVDLTSAGGKVLSVKSISLSSLREDSPQLAPDGHDVVLRSSRAAGRGQLWRTDIDGQTPVKITETTDPGWVGSPHWSPDGKWIAMDYRPADHSQIWMIDSEGRNFHAVIADQYENFVPRWSRDGRSMYFTSNRSGEWQIWKIDLASGQKTRITDQGGISAFESYDGSTLYYAKRECGGIFRRPLSGGPEVRVTDRLHVRHWGAFAVTENGIYFLDTEATPRPTIFYFDLRTGRSIPVLPMDRMPVPDDPTLTATRDGRILLFTEWDAVTHINLAEASP